MRRLSILWIKRFDAILLGSLVVLTGVGLLTMKSFTDIATSDYFFIRQLIWLGLSFFAMFGISFIDSRLLRRSGILVGIYGFLCLLLIFLLFFGQHVRGARGWINLGSFSLQPFEFMKLALILIIAKYFARRHIEIGNFRHIVISGLYVTIPAVLILLQPDFGGALMMVAIWLGLIMVSGVSKKHFFILTLVGSLIFGFLWLSIFTPNQKGRILSFVYPLEDIRGAGYSAFQSTIAVGSGQLFGKGVGFGTQSRLSFLPEYQTDFIFAAFAEEWGLVGTIIYFLFFGLMIWRIIEISMRGESNFEILYGLGLAVFFMSQFTINIGMNIGLLPVTGLPLPFTSYGGSHLLAEFIGLGILFSMGRYSYAKHRDDLNNEFIGGV